MCNLYRSIPVLAAATVLAVMPISAAPMHGPQSTAPDNTKVNKRDQKKSEPTADQAKNTKSDREIMADIRKAVVADKSLSTYAHNVKIISQHGKVTLKGPVHTDDEKKAIEAKAAEVVGEANVTSQITVKGDSKK